MVVIRPRSAAARGCTLVLFALAGCGVLHPPDPSPPLANDLVLVPGGACPSRRAAGLTGPTVVYLNFGGATVTKVPYNEDADKNTSFVGSGSVPAFAGDAATKSQVVSGVKGLFAAFNVSFVTSRPGSGDYDMVVVGGDASAVGIDTSNLPSGSYLGGISPLDCGNQMPRNVAFVFSDSILLDSGKPYAATVATSIAHEAGHTYGLPHSDDGCDIMSYASCGAQKAFLDKSMGMQDPASADPSQDLRCGMSSMNSHQLLLATLGKSGSAPPPPLDTQPPQVIITAPVNGASVQSSITIKASITDDTAVSSAELLVDGALKATLGAPPFAFAASLSPGTHTLSVQALDAAGNKGSASVSVTVDSSTSPTTPPPVTQPGAGEFGQPCKGSEECQSGLCISGANGASYCSQACTPGTDACPAGTRCVSSSRAGEFLCITPLPADDPTENLEIAMEQPELALEGGCSMGGDAGSARGLLLLLVGLLLLAGRRRFSDR